MTNKQKKEKQILLKVRYGQKVWSVIKKNSIFIKTIPESAWGEFQELVEFFPIITEQLDKEASFKTIVQFLFDLQVLMHESKFYQRFALAAGYDINYEKVQIDYTHTFIKELQHVISEGVEQLFEKEVLEKFGIDFDFSGKKIHELFEAYPLSFIQIKKI